MTDDQRRRLIAESMGVDPDDLVELDPSNPSDDIMQHIAECTGIENKTDYASVHQAARAAAITLADELWEAHLTMREEDPSTPEKADVEPDAVRSFVMNNVEDTLQEWGVDERLWRIITDFTALHQLLIDAVIDTYTNVLRDTLSAKQVTNSAEEDFDAAIADFLGGKS